MILPKTSDYLANKKVTFATKETFTFIFPVSSGHSYLSWVVGFISRLF